jgi:hypothetical protein
MRTGKAAFERMQRVSAILAKRYAGQGLAEIAAAENCTIQNISQLIQRALTAAPKQSVEQIRLLEAGRLDAMQNAIWPQCLAGDIAAIDRVLAIMKRRAAMMGLDLQPGYFSRDDGDGEPAQIRVVIEGDPERQRVRWLEDERRRLLALTEGGTPPGSTLN